jgi:arylsulfatase A-like enzyme
VLRFVQEAQAEKRPVFVFLHTYEVHSPYRPPWEVRTLLGVPEDAPDVTSEWLLEHTSDAAALPPGALDALSHLYDAEIRHTDDRLRELFGGLDALGFFERAVVLVTSDHGEEFGEHGRMLHSQVYEETARVPIVLRDGPRRVVARPSGPVELGDLFATLARRAGVEVAGPPLPGRDLLDPGALDGEATPVFLQDKQFHGRAAVRLGDWKLHLDRRTGGRRLFDLAADPGERDDRAAAEPARAAELAALLERRIARERELAPRWRPERRGPLEREELESLRALGYLR